MRLKTPHGPARAQLHEAEDPIGALILGHGAGGGISAPDLAGVTKAAVERRFAVALVEQPYRVAGRRSPAPAAQLDAAWTAVVEHLRARALGGPPLAAGAPPRWGSCRSSPAGARRARASPAAPRRGPARSGSCASPSRSTRRAAP